MVGKRCSKHVASIQKQHGAKIAKEGKTQLRTALNEAHAAYRVTVLIEGTEPIQRKTPHAPASSGKKAHIERHFGTLPVGLDTADLETGGEDETPPQGHIVPPLQHE